MGAVDSLPAATVLVGFLNMEIQGSAIQNLEDICSRNYEMNQAELLGYL